MCGPEDCPCRAGTLRFVGEAIPRDTEFPPLTLNSQRNESLTHKLFLKMQGRMRRQEKGLESKKRKGEGNKDEEGGCDKDNAREVSGQRELGGDGEGNRKEEKGKREQKIRRRGKTEEGNKRREEREQRRKPSLDL